MRIALLEDDTHQAQVRQVGLEAAGHACHGFPTGKVFRAGLARRHYDLLVLDWVLPDTAGISPNHDEADDVPGNRAGA